MTTHADKELADDARRLSEHRCPPLRAAVQAGPDEAGVVAQVATAWNCDGLLVAARARRRSFGESRRSLAPTIAERTGFSAVELPAG